MPFVTTTYTPAVLGSLGSRNRQNGGVRSLCHSALASSFCGLSKIGSPSSPRSRWIQPRCLKVFPAITCSQGDRISFKSFLLPRARRESYRGSLREPSQGSDWREAQLSLSAAIDTGTLQISPKLKFPSVRRVRADVLSGIPAWADRMRFAGCTIVWPYLEVLLLRNRDILRIVDFLLTVIEGIIVSKTFGSATADFCFSRWGALLEHPQAREKIYCGQSCASASPARSARRLSATRPAAAFTESRSRCA